MKLAITPRALETLKENRKSEREALLLFYDTEDCGCGVNGVPTVRFIEARKEGFTKVENESIPVWMNSRQAAFFEEEMKLDFINHAFRLSSPAGILNPVITNRDLRRKDTA